MNGSLDGLVFGNLSCACGKFPVYLIYCGASAEGDVYQRIYFGGRSCYIVPPDEAKEGVPTAVYYMNVSCPGECLLELNASLGIVQELGFLSPGFEPHLLSIHQPDTGLSSQVSTTTTSIFPPVSPTSAYTTTCTITALTTTCTYISTSLTTSSSTSSRITSLAAMENIPPTSIDPWREEALETAVMVIGKSSYLTNESVAVSISANYCYDLWILEPSGWFLALQNNSGDVEYVYSSGVAGNYSVKADFYSVNGSWSLVDYFELVAQDGVDRSGGLRDIPINTSGLVAGDLISMEKTVYLAGESVNINVMPGDLCFDLWIMEPSGWFMALQNASENMSYYYSTDLAGNYSVRADYYSPEGVFESLYDFEILPVPDNGSLDAGVDLAALVPVEAFDIVYSRGRGSGNRSATKGVAGSSFGGTGLNGSGGQFIVGEDNGFSRTQRRAIVGEPVEWTVVAGNLSVSYKTPAPYIVEDDSVVESGRWTKKVLVGSNVSIHYYNVSVSLDLGEGDRFHPRMYWIVNGSRIDVTGDERFRVSFTDDDDDGSFDLVSWIVPRLSDQEFEVEADLVILNVQSYPVVGGNWTVMFNTTGTADLVITAVDGTTWSDSDESGDLRFLEVRCGGEVLDYEWLDGSMRIGGYSCDGLSYEVSKVLTSGKHHLEFRFGNVTVYAHNDAGSSLSIYNFSVLSDKNAFEKNGSASNPSDYDSEASGDDYGDINASDGERWVTALASGNGFDTQIFTFNVSESIAAINSLNVSWEGYGDNNSGYYTNLSVWNWSAGSWHQLDSKDYTSNEDDYLSALISSGVGDYVNSSTGQVAVMVSTQKYVYVEDCACSGTGYETHTVGSDTYYVDCNADLCWSPTSGTTKTWGPYIDEVDDSCIGKGDSYPACDYCDDLDHAGFTDWTCPTQSVLNNLCASGSCSGTCFGGEGQRYYWSSSEYPGYNWVAYYVDFDACVETYNNAKSIANSVRCVRSGSSPFIYVYRDGVYEKVSDFIPGATSADKEYLSFTDVSGADVVDGVVRLKITEELPETTYLDRVYLLAEGEKLIELDSISDGDPGLLNESDDRYLVLEQGDEHYLEFTVDVFERLEFAAEGYYLWLTEELSHNSLYTDYVELQVNFTNPSFNVSLLSPGNGSSTSDSTPDFNYSVIGSESSYSCTLYVNGSAYGTNASTLNNTNSNITANDTLSDGNYTWYVNCTSGSTTNMSQVWSLMVDSTAPVVTLAAPGNNTQWTASSMVNFTFNVTDDSSISYCNLSINGVVNLSNASIIKDVNQSFNMTLANGLYNWSINCTDSLGLNGYSGEFNVSVNVPTPVISLERVYPVGDMNVTLNEFFNITVNVTCLYADCGDINVSFDPGQEVVENFTSNGSWECPSGVTSVQVECWGAGGGGKFQGKSGGGGGAYSKKTCSVTPSESYAYIVGSGGAAASPGGDTSWNSNEVLAKGGAGGGDTSSPGGQAADGVGSTKYSGGDSGTPDPNNGGGGGGGAGSSGDGKDASGMVAGGSTSEYGGAGGDSADGMFSDAFPGSDYGGGGGGSGLGAIGVGAQGFIRITYELSAGKSGLVSTTPGETPFYTNSSTNPVTINLNASQSQLVTIWVNASGDADTTHTFFEFANMTSNMSVSNITSEYNLTIVEAAVAFNVSLLSPSNESSTSDSTPDFNYTVTGTGSSYSCTLYVNGSAYGTNSSTLNNTVSNITANATLSDGIYSWYVNCTSSGTTNQSEIRELTVDSTAPVVYPEYPLNVSGDGDGNVSFVFNVSDVSSVVNCSLYVDGVYNDSNSSVATGGHAYFSVGGFSVGRYNWSLNCSDAVNNSNVSETWFFDVILMAGFSGGSTNLSLVDTSDIENLSLVNAFGGITYNGSVNLSGGADLDSLVVLSYNNASVDSVGEERLNRSATLSLYGLSYLETPVVYRDLVLCDDCAINSYEGGNLSFNVTGFTAYTAGENANLTIWDSNDTEGGGETVYVDGQAYFYANYTNKTSGSSVNGSGVYCNISFNVSGSWEEWQNMSFNESSLLYEYNRSFDTNGTFDWNVSCNGSALGYEPLDVVDNVSISEQSYVYYIDNCTNLTVAGATYYLTANITNSPITACMNISANNVTLDCQNNIIDSIDSTPDYGIYASRSVQETTNITVRNCQVKHWDSAGIYFYKADGNTFENINASDNLDYGIRLDNSDSNNITNITANSNSQAGILAYYSDLNILTDIIANSNHFGITLSLSNSNILTNITANSNIYDGVYLEYPNAHTLTNITVQENGYYDVGIYANSASYCDNTLQNVTGSNDLPIEYYNYSATIQNRELSELILCDADNSVVRNVTINASQTKKNNVLYVLHTSGSTISDIVSSDNYYGLYLSVSPSNTLSNITASSNSQYGLYFSSSGSNTLSNVTAGSNSQYGLYFFSSGSNTLSNVTAGSNSYGIYFYYNSDDNTIANSTISNSASYGIYFKHSGSSIPENNRIYNCLINETNPVGFEPGYTGSNYWNTTNQTGTRIFGPGNDIGGNFYTNSTGGGFSVDCADDNYDGFCDDYYNVSTNSACSSETCGNNTDYLALSDGYAEISFSVTPDSPDNESTVSDATPEFNYTVSGMGSSYSCTLYLNDTAYGTNASTLNNTNSNITANATLSDGVYSWYVNCTSSGTTNQSEIRSLTVDAVSPFYISNCTDFTLPGTYYLTSNITNSDDSYCMNISVNNVRFDCQGNMIDGTNSTPDYGIYVSRASQQSTNVTVRNCSVMEWDSAGIYFYKADGNLIEDVNSSYNPDHGLHLYYSDSNNVTNVSFDHNIQFGLYSQFCLDNSIMNLTASSNMYGVYFSSSYSNTLSNSTLNGNSLDVFVYGSAAYCNNLLENVTGTGGLGIEYYNYSVNISNRVLSELVLCNADGSNVTNVTIDTSESLHSNSLIILQTDNATVAGCVSSHNYRGIYLGGSSSGVNISDTVLNSNSQYGIFITAAYANNLSNITADSNMVHGVFFYSDSDNNTLSNSTISGSGTSGIAFDDSFSEPDNNLVYNCIVNESTGVTFYSGADGSNYWNTSKVSGSRIHGAGNLIGGNYWTNPGGNGYSDTCDDNDTDGFCDLSYDLGGTGENIDYWPLSDEYVDNSFSVSLDSPENDSTSSDSTPDFNYTVLGTGSSYSCTLYLNDTAYGTNASTLNNTNSNITANATLSDGVYSWYVNCTVSGTTNQSEIRELTVDAVSPFYISNCTDFTLPGTYYLTGNVTNSTDSYCMNISVNNVTLDCQDNVIDSTDSTPDYGIYANRSVQQTTNITVRNCRVTQWDSAGIYFGKADGNVFENITSSDNADMGDSMDSGFYLYYSDSNNLTNITASSNSMHGIFLLYSDSSTISDITADSSIYGLLLTSSKSNNLTNITADSNDYGLYLYMDSDSNTIANSTVSNSGSYGIYLHQLGSTPENNTIYNCLINGTNPVGFEPGYPGSNYWNGTDQAGTRIYGAGNNIGGNFYTNSTGGGFSVDCADDDYDGFCDDYYNVSTNSACSSETCGNNTDYLALSDEYTEISFSVTLDSPDNESTVSDATPDFNYTVSGTVSTYSCTLYLNDTAYGTNTTTLNNTISNITANATLSDGVYSWYVNCTVSGTTNQSAVRELTVDTVALVLNFTYPTEENGSTINRNWTLVNVSVDDSDSGLDSFIFNWNGTNYSFDADAGNGSVLYSGDNENLLLAFNFNEGTGDSTGDLSGYGNNGTIGGSALNFDGVDDYVDCGDTPSLNMTSAITVEAWVKLSSLSGAQTIVSKAAAAGWGIEYNVPSENKFSWAPHIAGSYRIVPADNNASAAVWYDLVGTYDGSTVKFYVNGVLQNSTIDVGGGITASPVQVEIGSNPPGVDHIFNGSIDEVRIYNRSLSATEVVEHYNGVYTNETGLVLYIPFSDRSGTTADDKSGLNNDGTLTNFADTSAEYGDTHDSGWTTYGRPLWTYPGKYAYGMRFNGYDDYVDVGGVSVAENLAQISVAAWAKTDIVNNTFRQIISKQENGAWGLLLYDDNKWAFDPHIAGAYRTVKSNATANADEWYYLVGTYDGNTVRLYVNGILQSNPVTTSGNIGASTEEIAIGANPGPGNTFSQYFNGTIDDIRVYNRSLSAEEIHIHYESSLQRHNSTNWQFYSNVTGLTDGTYTYYAWANNTFGNGSYTISYTADSPRYLVVNMVPSTPVVSNVSVGDMDGGNVELSVADDAIVYCNATVTDGNGWTDIVSANATLYRSSSNSSAADDKNVHYTNSSCTLFDGSGTERNASCAFVLEHEALSGTWTCNLTAYDSSGSGSGLANVTVDQLVALSILEDSIDFGSMGVGENSSSAESVNVSNEGNMGIDVRVNGSDMSCSGSGSIGVANVSYSTSSGDYDSMSSSKLSGGMVTLSGFDLGVEGIATAEDLNSTKLLYWTMQVPSSVSGVCSNTITVTAVIDEDSVESYFVVQNDSGSNVATFSETGAIVLLGSCISGGSCASPPDGSFVMENASNVSVAYVDMDGNLCIQDEDCSDYDSDCSSAPDGSFIVENDLGQSVLYINSTGNLCMEGELTESGSP